MGSTLWSSSIGNRAALPISIVLLLTRLAQSAEISSQVWKQQFNNDSSETTEAITGTGGSVDHHSSLTTSIHGYNQSTDSNQAELTNFTKLVQSTDSHWSVNSTASGKTNSLWRNGSTSQKQASQSPVHANSGKHLTSARAVTPFMKSWVLLLIVVGVTLFVVALLYFCIRCCCYREEDVVKELQAWRSTARPVVLLATVPHHDPYLTDAEACDDGAVRLNNIGAPFYMLPAKVTLVKGSTGQLLHPPSGLLFNPVQGYHFDPINAAVVSAADHSQIAPNSNLVYHPPTKRLYERCLTMCSKAGAWSLSHSPVGGNKNVQPIRRARPDELPLKLAAHYSNMLAEWKQTQVQQQVQSEEHQVHQASGQHAPVVVVVMPQDKSQYEDALSKIIPL